MQYRKFESMNKSYIQQGKSNYIAIHSKPGVIQFLRIRLLKIIWKNIFVANEYMFQDMDNEKRERLKRIFVTPKGHVSRI